MSKIVLPEGIKIGHCDNGVTGVTVILSEEGCVGGVDVRGCAPGTRETDLLRPEKAIETVNAIVLTGGSAYGLESMCGVMKYLSAKGCGHRMGDKVVPLVSGAVIYDLNGDGYNYPDSAMGYEAAKNAVDKDINWGGVGVGKGATVGKIRGPMFASKGGIGAATINVMGVNVTAVVAVNASGDVIDPMSGKVIAGAKDNNGNFVNVRECVLNGDFGALMTGANTTIGCIMTDAKLTKLQANKLATIAHNGYARTISPVHTDYDGDTIFCLSSGIKNCDFTMLSVAAVEAVERAVIAAVTE